MLFIGLKTGPEPLCKQQLLGLFGTPIDSCVLWIFIPNICKSLEHHRAFPELISADERGIAQEPSATASVGMRNNQYLCMEVHIQKTNRYGGSPGRCFSLLGYKWFWVGKDAVFNALSDILPTSAPPCSSDAKLLFSPGYCSPAPPAYVTSDPSLRISKKSLLFSNLPS